MRANKVAKIADYIPNQTLDNGNEKGKLLVLGWGSTYGAIKAAVKEAREKGYDVSHAHLRHINPFPKNLGELLYNFDKVLVPEMNLGQLNAILRDKYLVPTIPLNKVKGLPFSTGEILEKIEELLK
jgi:2-oxoglutarate ferredoxin oxidoreductase subunit alpha